MGRKKEERRRAKAPSAWGACVILCLFLLSVPVSYAGPKVVYKDARALKELAEAEKEEKYSYDPTGKTDPFQPFIVKEESGPKQAKKQESEKTEQKENKALAEVESLLQKLKEPKTELQRIALSQLTLKAVVKTKDQVLAMVSDPDGRGYVLKKGTYIGTNGGVVDGIVDEEKKTDLGQQSVRKVVIKEPYVNRDGNLDYKFTDMEMPD